MKILFFNVFLLCLHMVNPGTLYKHLDHCITASGKRLLRRWICHPLKDVTDINHRLNIVDGFIKHSGIISIIVGYLHRLPDLERLLGRVRSTVGSSSTLLLPFVGERVLKQRVIFILLSFPWVLIFFLSQNSDIMQDRNVKCLIPKMYCKICKMNNH